jgi:hypothetical protein
MLLRTVYAMAQGCNSSGGSKKTGTAKKPISSNVGAGKGGFGKKAISSNVTPTVTKRKNAISSNVG